MFNNKKRKVLTLILTIFILIIFFNIFQKNVKNFIYIISSPFQKAFWQAGKKTAGFLKTFAEIEKTRIKIEKLAKENQKLTAEIAELKELKKENEILRKALGAGLQKDFKLSFAQIIGKDIYQDFILINKGAVDGISKDMPVISAEKVLLGKVGEVYKNFSKVMLISNKKMSFGVKIQNSDDISGAGKGKGNFKILIDFIPREKEILKGNLVVSDSLGGIFPNGFLVGKVKKIEKKDTEVFQKIEVECAFNIKELDKVFIITGKK